jgi:hypothetical protein
MRRAASRRARDGGARAGKKGGAGGPFGAPPPLFSLVCLLDGRSGPFDPSVRLRGPAAVKVASSMPVPIWEARRWSALFLPGSRSDPDPDPEGGSLGRERRGAAARNPQLAAVPARPRRQSPPCSRESRRRRRRHSPTATARGGSWPEPGRERAVGSRQPSGGARRRQPPATYFDLDSLEEEAEKLRSSFMVAHDARGRPREAAQWLSSFPCFCFLPASIFPSPSSTVPRRPFRRA